MKIDIYDEDGEIISGIASDLNTSVKEAVYLILKFYHLRDPSDIQSIKWKLITRLKNKGFAWSYLLTLRFLYITLGEILRQTNFHVREK